MNPIRVVDYRHDPGLSIISGDNKMKGKPGFNHGSDTSEIFIPNSNDPTRESISYNCGPIPSFAKFGAKTA